MDTIHWSGPRVSHQMLTKKESSRKLCTTIAQERWRIRISLQNPSRTIITAEVGTSVSRTRHIIEPKKDTFRRLTPVELERLNGFPPNWTYVGKVSDSRRGFLMGNALVIGIVRKLAGPLADVLHRRPSS